MLGRSSDIQSSPLRKFCRARRTRNKHNARNIEACTKDMFFQKWPKSKGGGIRFETLQCARYCAKFFTYIVSPSILTMNLWDGLFISCLYKWGNRCLGRLSIWPKVTAAVSQHWNPGLETLHHASTFEYTFQPQRIIFPSSLPKKSSLRFNCCLLNNNISIQLIFFWNFVVK